MISDPSLPPHSLWIPPRGQKTGASLPSTPQKREGPADEGKGWRAEASSNVSICPQKSQAKGVSLQPPFLSWKRSSVLIHFPGPRMTTMFFSFLSFRYLITHGSPHRWTLLQDPQSLLISHRPFSRDSHISPTDYDLMSDLCPCLELEGLPGQPFLFLPCTDYCGPWIHIWGSFSSHQGGRVFFIYNPFQIHTLPFFHSLWRHQWGHQTHSQPWATVDLRIYLGKVHSPVRVCLLSMSLPS